MRLRFRLSLACTAIFFASGICPPASQARTNTSPASDELAWAVPYDPKTLDPAKVDDQVSELVRYLTGGVLVRLNRTSMAAEPELAESWRISADGKAVTFRLRTGLHFSDGSPLRSSDVAGTLRRVLSPATAAPVADEFVAPAKVTVETPDELTVVLHLSSRVVNVAAVFDEIAIEPANRPTGASVTSGPYFVAEYHQGEFLRLRRNSFYWRHGSNGLALPYLPTLRLDVLANRETEELRFLHGQYALLGNVSPDTFGPLNRKLPGVVHDLGPSLNTEQMWFNQAQGAPLPSFEKQWFRSKVFRTAISMALHRADMARIAFDGHATPANGFISPTNRFWYNQAQPPVREDLQGALRLLASDGYQKRGSQLFDREGHPVQFSLLTNAGNHARERMASLIQQDLAALGVGVHVVSLDFPALVERLMHTSDYEAALLGLSNVQPDPGTMMNIWLSSSPNHQWNPSEKAPATPWEADIDQAMLLQAGSADPGVRKAAIDRVQAIVAEQQPFIYLVYPNTLCAVSLKLEGEQLSVLQPAVVSSIQTMRWKGNPH